MVRYLNEVFYSAFGSIRERHVQLQSPAAIVRVTTSGAVAERLRTDIQSGELPPGTHLRQAEVAQRYAVSTTPVREAFQMLQAEGLLTIDPHRGAVVFRPSREEMRESFEIRIALEQLALAKAIPNMTDGAFAELQEVIDTMRATDDPAQWRQLNTRFHRRLYEHSGRPHLCSLIANLTDATTGYSQMATLRAPRSWWADDQHQALLEACRLTDARRAQRIVREHLSLTVNFIFELLAKQPEIGTGAGLLKGERRSQIAEAPAVARSPFAASRLGLGDISEGVE
jgi:DNA-binding GntR family transcriptional regulator